MTGLDLLLAVAGFTVTVLVVVGMILITPRGQVEVVAEDRDADEAAHAQGTDVRADWTAQLDTAASPTTDAQR